MIPANLEGMPLCGAKTKHGAPCKQPARRGGSRCRKHGGNTPEALVAAGRRVAVRDATVGMQTYGSPRRVTALDALEDELARTQGHVDWLAGEVARNPDPGTLVVYQAERAHLAKLSHQMLSANVAERRTVIEERAVERLEEAVTRTLRELGYDPAAPHVRATLTRHLRAVQADDPVRHDVTHGRPADGDATGDAWPEPVAF